MAGVPGSLQQLPSVLSASSDIPPTFVLQQHFNCSKEAVLQFYVQVASLRKAHPLLVQLQIEHSETLPDGTSFAQAHAVEDVKLVCGLVSWLQPSKARRWYKPGSDTVYWVAKPVSSTVAVNQSYEVSEQQEDQCLLVQKTWITGIRGPMYWLVTRIAQDTHTRSLQRGAALLDKANDKPQTESPAAGSAATASS